jgi:hypothetical protein
VFASDSKAVIYYWPGTTGWSSPFAGITAVLFPFTYLASPGGVTIDGFSGSVAAVVIPATIDDVPVTSIGTAAFASNPIPTSITIPASITNIGVGAFAFCPNLKTITMGTPNLYYSSVNGVLYNQSLTTLIQYPGGLTGSYVIPDGVTNLVAGACAGAKLTAVTIVNTVTSIGIGAFSGCASLTTINVVTPNSFYSGSGGVLFNQGQTTLLQAPGGLKGNYVIPSSVTSIGAGAFQYCSSRSNPNYERHQHWQFGICRLRSDQPHHSRLRHQSGRPGFRRLRQPDQRPHFQRGSRDRSRGLWAMLQAYQRHDCRQRHQS